MLARFTRVAVLPFALLLTQCAEETHSPVEPLASRSETEDYRLREAFAALESGDHETAWFRLWDMAIEGDPVAQVHLARLYREGTGIPADPRIERRWIEHAATAGHPLAQFRLGELYEAGGGDAVNRQAAALWYERAAAQGYGPARQALQRLRGQIASPAN
jgi:TPR repeat protein